MTKKQDDVARQQLRNSAEAVLEKRAFAKPSGGNEHQRTLHELQVHQIELAMQFEELQTVNALNESLLQTVPFPMNIVDAQGTILYANAPMESIRSALRRSGRCWEVYRDSQTQCHDCPLKEPIVIGVTKLIESSGVFGGRTVEVHHTGMTYSGKTALMEIFIDITERKRIEQQTLERKEELTKLYAALQSAREDERHVVARELHDDLGQRLTALRMDLDWMEEKFPYSSDLALVKSAKIRLQVDELADAIRRLTEDLRPAMLDVLGLVAAVQGYGTNFSERTGIECKVSASSEEVDVESDTAIGIFRIVQEALNNVQKHAKATRVSVHIHQDLDSISVTIEDNGIGLPKQTPGMRSGFGLLGMQERVTIMGGTVEIKGAAEHGVHIEVVIPISKPKQ